MMVASCLHLAKLSSDRGDYEKAMYAAQGGFYVEEYFYTPKHRIELLNTIGGCLLKDQGLRVKYDRAIRAPYSLL
jgi:hypothetical protein